MKQIILYILLSLNTVLIAQSPLFFSEMIENLTNTLAETQVSSRKLRLALMPLNIAGGDPTQITDKFGAYFTETLTGRLSKETDRYKLYERSRLDALLQEASLTQSGLMDADAALKIGELAPIDVILSGTYSILTKTIAVNMRLIDVVSGEILVTYQQNIYIDKDLQTLLSESRHQQKKDPCLEKRNYLNNLLNDLSTEEKVERIVRFATHIPFDMDCGKIHFDLISTFRRYNIEDKSYRLFMIKTLNGIKYPTNDERALAIIKYLGKDTQIDEQEWQSGLTSISRVGNRYLSSYLSALLFPEGAEADQQIVNQRAKVFLEKALDKEIGLPVPVGFTFAFFELMDAFNYVYTKSNQHIFPIYQSYSAKLERNAKTIPKIHSLLSKMYWRESDSQRRRDILDWLIRHYQEREMDKKAADDIFGFARDLQVKGTGSYKHNDEIPAPQEHRQIFLNQCETLFCDGLKISKFRSQIEDREDFCLTNGIPCPGIIPTVEECLTMLDAEDSSQRDRAAEILAKMGQKADKAEKKLIEILEDSGVSDRRYSRLVRQQAIITLGNLKTKNPKAINVLCESLGSTEYKIPDFASDALVQIGIAAVEALSERLFHKFGSVQYKAAVILGRIGPAARGALKSLRKVIETTNNSAVHSAAKQAVKMIDGN
jgi:hypothetical protein